MAVGWPVTPLANVALEVAVCFAGTALAVSASSQLEPLVEAPVILLGVVGSTLVPLRHSPAVINGGGDNSSNQWPFIAWADSARCHDGAD